MIDEVHCRNIEQDTVLLILREPMLRRIANGLYVPRLILSSSSADVPILLGYFSPLIEKDLLPPRQHLAAENQKHSVEKLFLDDLLRQRPLSELEVEAARLKPKAITAVRNYIMSEKVECYHADGMHASAKATISTFDKPSGSTGPPIELVVIQILEICQKRLPGSILAFVATLDDAGKAGRLVAKR